MLVQPSIQRTGELDVVIVDVNALDEMAENALSMEGICVFRRDRSTIAKVVIDEIGR